MNHKSGSAVNIDSDFLWYIYKSCGDDLSDIEKKLSAYVDSYRNSGISDLFYCVFTQSSVFPSRTMSWLGDALDRKEEGGIAVDYSGHDRLLPYKQAYSDPHFDPIAFLLERTAEAGMRGWLSVRMNDCHQSHEPTSWLRGELYYKARDNGWMIGDHVATPYFGECLDYSHNEVRCAFVDYISEILDRYDTDGIELDFMREIFCFDYLNTPGCADIMTEFLTRVSACVRKKEQERGHRIRLAVRLGRDIGYDLTFGFDVKGWIRAGLVDVLIPSSRWRNTDSEIPVSEWKRISEGCDVEIWPSLEFFLAAPAVNSPETVKAFAAQYLDEGADKIYLFNYYRECLQSENDEWNIYGIDTSRFMPYNDNFRSIDFRNRNSWIAASNTDIAHSGERRHILTYVEEALTPKGVSGFLPLPIDIDGAATLTKLTGNAASCGVVLYLGVKNGDAPDVTVDGNTAKPLGATDDAYYSFCDLFGATGRDALGDSCFYAYAVTPNGGNLRRIDISGSCRITYLEVKITAASANDDFSL